MDDLSVEDCPDVARVRRPRRPKPQVLQLIPEPNGHLIEKAGKQYRCATCGERGRSRTHIALTPCGGPPR
eukprot:644384-Pyramimonas_sp.AAC.1